MSQPHDPLQEPAFTKTQVKKHAIVCYGAAQAWLLMHDKPSTSFKQLPHSAQCAVFDLLARVVEDLPSEEVRMEVVKIFLVSPFPQWNFYARTAVEIMEGIMKTCLNAQARHVHEDCSPRSLIRTKDDIAMAEAVKVLDSLHPKQD